MLLQELLGALDDVVARLLAPGVDVACCKFLAKADGTTWLAHINDVALASEYLQWVLEFQRLGRGRTAAIIVDDEGVFLVGIKVWWQEVEAVDAVATA